MAGGLASGGASGGLTGGGSVGGVARTVLILILGGLVVLIGLVIAGAALIFTGSPAACADRVITPDAASSRQLRAQWRDYGQQAARGPAEVTFTEQQVTSRGVEYVGEKNVSVEELQVYFCPDGTAEASGKIEVLGMKAKVVLRGTLDISGDRPRIQIHGARAGNLPAAIAKPAVDLILDTDNLRALNIKEPIGSITYSDGRTRIRSVP